VLALVIDTGVIRTEVAIVTLRRIGALTGAGLDTLSPTPFLADGALADPIHGVTRLTSRALEGSPRADAVGTSILSCTTIKVIAEDRVILMRTDAVLATVIGTEVIVIAFAIVRTFAFAQRSAHIPFGTIFLSLDAAHTLTVFGAADLASRAGNFTSCTSAIGALIARGASIRVITRSGIRRITTESVDTLIVRAVVLILTFTRLEARAFSCRNTPIESNTKLLTR